MWRRKAVRIAIVDADLIARKRHRFPNLVCMKLSGYFKAAGNPVALKTDYEGLDRFGRVYIAKVFTDTEVPEAVLRLPNVRYGGTGFFYDKAEPLPPAAPETVKGFPAMTLSPNLPPSTSGRESQSMRFLRWPG